MLYVLFLSSIKHLRYPESAMVVYKTIKHPSLFNIQYLLYMYLRHVENLCNFIDVYICLKLIIEYFTNIKNMRVLNTFMSIPIFLLYVK